MPEPTELLPPCSSTESQSRDPVMAEVPLAVHLQPSSPAAEPGQKMVPYIQACADGPLMYRVPLMAVSVGVVGAPGGAQMRRPSHARSCVGHQLLPLDSGQLVASLWQGADRYPYMVP